MNGANHGVGTIRVEVEVMGANDRLEGLHLLAHFLGQRGVDTLAQDLVDDICQHIPTGFDDHSRDER